MIGVGGWTVRKRVLWTLLAFAVISVLWMLKVEIIYRHNVNRIPALYQFSRHVVTRMWTA